MLALLLLFLGIYILYKVPSSFWITISRFIWDPTPQGRRDRARRAANFYIEYNGPHVGTDSHNDLPHCPDPLNSHSDRCGNDGGSSYDGGSSSSYDSGSSSSYDSGSSSSDSW